MKLISSSTHRQNETSREAAILKNCPSAIITSLEVIIAEYDAFLSQWERENFWIFWAIILKWDICTFLMNPGQNLITKTLVFLFADYSAEENLFQSLQDGTIDKAWLFDCKETGDKREFKIVKLLDVLPIIRSKLHA